MIRMEKSSGLKSLADDESFARKIYLKEGYKYANIANSFGYFKKVVSL